MPTSGEALIELQQAWHDDACLCASVMSPGLEREPYRCRYELQPTQELLAIGYANIVGALFNSYTTTGSFSRCAGPARTLHTSRGAFSL